MTLEMTLAERPGLSLSRRGGSSGHKATVRPSVFLSPARVLLAWRRDLVNFWIYIRESPPFVITLRRWRQEELVRVMCMFNGRNVHQDQKVIVSENTRKGE